MDTPLLEALSAASSATLEHVSAQDLATTAWSFSKLSFDNVPLWASIASAALRLMTEFRSSDLANLAWSFPSLSFLDDALLEAISA